MARTKKSIRRVMAGLVASGAATTVALAAEVPALALGLSPDGGVGILACSSYPSVADPNVLKIVYEVGIGLNVPSKVMLAGFEAGWVESRMNNLPCGDRDSLGVFQQRPSQGWGTAEQIMNVNYAANAFFTRAIPVARDNPGYTAGQVAQAVQRSAFPERYDQAEGTARNLIEQARQLATPPRPIGTQTVGFWGRGDGSWHLTNDNNGPSDSLFVWGPTVSTNIVPLTGDWNNDGKDTIGFWNRADGSWHLTNDNSGSSDSLFVWGPSVSSNIVPLTGDWDGDGKDSVGFWNRADGSWHLTNDNQGPSDSAFVWGPAANPDITPIVGDWDNDGKDTVGFWNRRDGSWHLTNDNQGPSDSAFVWGPADSAAGRITPLAGDWNGDGKDTIGFWNRADGSWHLTNDNEGPSDSAFVWGPAGSTTSVPIIGDWNGA